MGRIMEAEVCHELRSMISFSRAFTATGAVAAAAKQEEEEEGGGGGGGVEEEALHADLLRRRLRRAFAHPADSTFEPKSRIQKVHPLREQLEVGFPVSSLCMTCD
jgi:hypothetical protein